MNTGNKTVIVKPEITRLVIDFRQVGKDLVNDSGDNLYRKEKQKQSVLYQNSNV